MNDGLEDVIAADTVLSEVNGLAGRLIVRGVPLEDLAGHARYEEVLALLWKGFFAGLPQDLQRPLGDARLAVYRLVEPELVLAADRPVFDAMRMLMARLPDSADPEAAMLLAAAPGILLPALIRLQRGLHPQAPEPALGHAEDMLCMLTGDAPDAATIAALDAYLVTVADHGLNASTFAARVVASTQAGLNSSVLAALGALKGPLHGGAPGPVLDMLDAIGTIGNAATWIENELEGGRRLMGFGHRIYRVRDPRADVLKATLAQLAKDGGIDHAYIAFANRVEAVALAALRHHKPDRALETNVEFYTALLLNALGFPRETFTAVFAAGRIAGWIAHAKEQAATGRLIRPKSRYVGPLPKAVA